jgi:catechol 2,3-dioxygenase-like lactoylglutathione lyase family enzyme
MSRVRLAHNVDDIDAAADFYSQLFDAEPAKRRPGSANFALDQPALKLVSIDNTGHGGSLNHLGGSSRPAIRRTWHAHPGTGRHHLLLPAARQDMGPSGEPWEVYTALADAAAEHDGNTRLDRDADPAPASGVGCCDTDTNTHTHAEQTTSASACCPV